MAVTNTFSAGVNTSFSSELNTNFTETTIHTKTHTDATERSHTGDTDWTDTATTFTVSANGGILTGIRYVADLKHSAGSGDLTSVRLKITGTNLGTYYAAAFPAVTGTTPDLLFNVFTTDATRYLMDNGGTSYGTRQTSVTDILLLLDDTTTITVQIKTSDAGDTAYVDEQTIIAMYTKVYKAD